MAYSDRQFQAIGGRYQVSSTADFDLVIVGAGAAGIGAGLVARSAGLRYRILEAGNRVGGRAHTIDIAGIPFDLGAHFLHFAPFNPFAQAALADGRQLGYRHSRGRQPTALYYGSRRADAETRDACQRFYNESFAAPDGAQGDIAAAEVIDTTSPFYPPFRNFYAAVNGLTPEECSTSDYQRYPDIPYDWTVKDGYGGLVTRLADGLDIALETPVRAIDRTGGAVRIETDQGTLSAKAVIVTVSTAVLASGAIRFTPALPNDVVSAFSHVRLGRAERTVLVADRQLPFELDGIVHAMPEATRHGKGAMLGMVFGEFGRPTVGGYLAAELAEEIATAEGPPGLAEHTKETAVEILGSDWRDRFIASASSCWTTDPLILGSYSAAMAGRGASRDVLAARFDERLLLAGEACSPNQYGTVHGAYATGTQAVADLIQAGLTA